MATTKDIASQYGFDKDKLEMFLKTSSYSVKSGLMKTTVEDGDVQAIVADFRKYLEDQAKLEAEKAAAAQEAAERKAQAEAEKQRALASMLITSGFNFDGYTITKYSGYISGDDVAQVDRGTVGFFTSGTNVGNALTDALVVIRRNALAELKEAAYNLGCNAVIGVDFDYITLEPETANSSGGTVYMPYVFCVTANGNAVIIEKDE